MPPNQQPSPTTQNTNSPQTLPRLWKEETPSSWGIPAGLAKIYKPASGGLGYVNVVKDYTWTLTPPSIRTTAPYITLKEFEVNESSLKRQLFFYGAAPFIGINGGILEPYKELFPKDRPTGFIYNLPYITDVNFELNTPVWQSLDTLEAGKGFIEDIAGIFGKRDEARNIMDGLGKAATFTMAAAFPKIGIMDRPKLWERHEFKQTAINFQLFNTHDPNDWKKNRDFIWLFLNQNLYNKRDFITGIPPCFYEVYVPGQHYSFASCVTNFTVKNVGNMRQLFDDRNMPANVPDVYDITIQLTDMVMPSKNLLQALQVEEVTSQLYSPTPSTIPG